MRWPGNGLMTTWQQIIHAMAQYPPDETICYTDLSRPKLI
jgi:hypothetical protein